MSRDLFILVQFVAFACVFGRGMVAVQADVQSSISYFVTVRSFMASACTLSHSESDREKFCPDDENIQQLVNEGKLAGHPDFQRLDNPPFAYAAKTSAVTKYNTSFAQFGRQFPLTAINDLSLVVHPFVLSTLKYDTTGIGRMQYCEGEEGYLCDFNDTTRSVNNKTSFSTWYSDSSTFNRRVGYKQPLFQVQPSSARYEFDAGNSDHNPLQNGLFDPITAYGLSSKVFPMSSFEKDGFKAPCGRHDPLPNDCKKGKYWFTTELHSNFFYQGGEQFTFAGDDDVHIFINGRLAINLGGEHSMVFATIDLDTYAEELSITKGNIYSFDMFHAERQTKGSNFKLTTTLSEACNVVSSDIRSNGADVTLGIDWQTPPASSEPTNNSDWFLLGGKNFAIVDPGAMDGKYVLLMTPGVSDVASYMFHTKQQNIGSGFSLSFNFRMSGTGHGFAAVLHDRSLGLSNFNGGSGPNLGIKNLENSFAIVFDMCPNFPDCSQGQQLSIHYRNDSNRMNAHTTATRTAYDPQVVQDWRDGEVHTVNVFYYAIPDWLEVYVDNSLRLVERGFDIQQIIQNRNAYVGFTSSSSTFGQSMKVQIGEVAIKTVKVNSKLSELVTPNSSFPLTLVADGKHATGITLQSRDACANPLRFGGLSHLAQGRALFKVDEQTSAGPRRTRLLDGDESQVIVEEEADIVDKQDGTYSIQFSTETLGLASVYVAFGSSCVWNETQAQFVDTGSDCWTMAFPDAVVAIAPETASPTEPGKDTNSLGLPLNVIIGLGVGLGAIILCCFIVAFVLLRYRRRWRKDKKFVKSGKLAKLDEEVELSKHPLGHKLEEMAHKVQKTSMEVLKLRAISEANDANQDLEAMKDETKRLKDEVKGMKRRQQEQELMEVSSSKRTTARDLTGAALSRVSFGQEQVNGGAMPSLSDILSTEPPPPPTTTFAEPVFVGRTNPKACFLVSISKRDVDHIISLANDHASVITGGEIFGQVYDSGDVYVMHSTGPGYSSKMDKDGFTQSASFLTEATTFLSQHSAFRIGSWVSTSIHSKPVSEVLRDTSATVRTAMNGGTAYIYILLVQLCGIKHGKMVVTITPFRYPTSSPDARSEIGDVYVYEDDATNSEATRRHEAIEVLRNRPPQHHAAPPPPPTPSRSASQQQAPPALPASRPLTGLPPNKRQLDAAPPPPPASRPLLPPGLPPPGASAVMNLTPRRLSVTDDDLNPLVPVLLDGSAEDEQKKSNGAVGTFKKAFFG